MKKEQSDKKQDNGFLKTKKQNGKPLGFGGGKNLRINVISSGGIKKTGYMSDVSRI